MLRILWVRYLIRVFQLELVLFFHCQANNSVDSDGGSVAKVVSSVALKLFPRCDILLLVDHCFEVENSRLGALKEALTERFATLFQQLYLIRINSSEDDHNFVNSFRASHLPGGNVKRNYFHPFSSMSKYRDNCALVIVATNPSDTSSDRFRFLSDFLTPKIEEISKKDEDHYIFIASEKQGRNLLLSGEFGSKLKYKLLIPLESMSYEIKFVTVCFFCNGGQPVFKYIDFNIEALSNQNLRSSSDINKGSALEEDVRDILFPDLVVNYNGSEFIAAFSAQTTRLETFRDDNGNYQRKRGMYFYIIDALQKRFNFKLKLIPSFGDQGTGRLLKNGTWFGSVGNVLYGTAHVGMTSAPTYQRNLVVGFAFSLQYEWITFTTGKAQEIHSWRTIFKPFKLSMWMAVISSSVGVIGTLMVIRKYLPRGWELGQLFQYIIGSVLEQSYKSPKDSAVRLLCSFWLSFGLVIATAYRSKLLTFLIFPEMTVAPTTFQELANTKDFKYGLMYFKGAAYAVFKTSTEDTYVKIFKNWELINDHTGCLERTTKENFACISWQSSAEHIAHRNFTDRIGRKFLVEAPASTFFIPCGFVLEKRAIFKNNFDKVIHWSHDTGLVSKWTDMDWAKVRKMRFEWEKSKEGGVSGEDGGGGHEYNDGPKPLENFNLIAAYSALLLFSCVSLAAFIVELIMDSRTITWNPCKIPGKLNSSHMAHQLCMYLRVCTLQGSMEPTNMLPLSKYE